MTNIQQLIEDYERRAKTAKEMANNHRRTSEWDIVSIERLDTKAALFRVFAYELGELLPREGNDIETAKTAVASLTDEQRGELMERYCRHCYTDESNCRCYCGPEYDI